MRTFSPLGAIAPLIVLALVVTGITQFARVSQLGNPFALGSGDAKPLPLAEAAPEAVRHREGFRRLAAFAKGAETLCRERSADGGEPETRGKALIWDDTTNDVSEAHGRLPADVRAPDATGEVTVFPVTRRDRTPVTDYNFDFFSSRSGPAGVRGFRTDSTVCVVGMPGARPLGRYKLSGLSPPFFTHVKEGTTDVDGDWEAPMARWVEGSVRGPQWRQKQRETPLPAGHEAFGRLAEQARTVLPQCEARGASRNLPPLPAKALVWESMPKVLINRLSPSHKLLPAERRAEPTDTNVLVVLVIGTGYSRPNGGRGVPPEKDVDRFDSTVALVVMPGLEPVGVYKVLGDEWPAERRRVKGDGPDTNQALARWVTDFLKKPAAGWPTAGKRESSR
jgi:hypothetical protein